MIIAPQFMQNEANHLIHECGVSDPMKLMSIDERCLITTPYHVALCRARELKRGEQRHGSVGLGVGATREYDLLVNGYGFRVKDVWRYNAAQMLNSIRHWVLMEIIKLEPWPSGMMKPLALLLKFPPDEFLGECRNVLDQATIVDRCPDFKTAVFEGAQGILLDENIGFHPYTTWSTTTLLHAYQMLAESPVDEICNLGLTRCYMTRHGAGPFPTEDAELAEKLSDPNNPPNDWQKTMRFGHLDMMLLEYAKKHLGGHLDCLAVSHLDQIENDVKICMFYDDPGVERVDRIPEAFTCNLDRQEQTGQMLGRVNPCYWKIKKDMLFDYLGFLAEITITADGETSDNRHLRRLNWRKW